eukprot:1145798-Pelagomonas_calceolata.AAC.4
MTEHLPDRVAPCRRMTEHLPDRVALPAACSSAAVHTGAKLGNNGTCTLAGPFCVSFAYLRKARQVAEASHVNPES